MQTKEKNAKGLQGTTAHAKQTTDVKTENRPNIPGKEKNDEPAKDQKPAEGAQGEAAQTAAAKAGNSVTVDNQPANPAEQHQAEELKSDEPRAEVRYIKPQNVETTIKEVEILHRRSIQRANLIVRKKQLETFEVSITQESDELNDNPFQGCKLIIEDDKKRQFVTTTPGLIRLVAQFIYEACDNKQAEIEAGIVFPNA